MDRNESRQTQRPTPASSKEYADTLGDVLRHEEAKKAAATTPARDTRKSSPLAWLLLVGLALCSAYLWLGSPAFLRPAPPPALPPRVIEAGMRVEVTLQAMRINAFMEREGRLPTTLEEAGNAFAEVRYERDDGQRYRLALDQGDLHVEYVSGQSLEAFLGDARRIILEER